MSRRLVHLVMTKTKQHGALQAYLAQQSGAHKFRAQLSALRVCWVQISARAYLAVCAALRACLRALQRTHPEQATPLARSSLIFLAEVGNQTHTASQHIGLPCGRAADAT